MLTGAELHKALLFVVKHAQDQALTHERQDAQRERPKLPVSRFLGLFVDQQCLLRVGGRLRQADLSEETKHPMLLSSDHPLTVLIVRHAHALNLHAGPTSTHAYLRSLFWILNGKNVVRKILSKCNRCFSVKPQPFSPPMGQLPAARTQPSPPFHTVGVDYAGPFQIRLATMRSLKTVQMYLAVFLCFSTKAIHIEVVTDASTPAFLAAYRRFVDRRGHPTAVWSDNGRNFVGANRELHQLSRLLRNSEHHALVQQETARSRTEWHFIPPHAPHFGGLWEAGVKAMKILLKTTIGAQIPTLEGFWTVTAQVEAILNSRPLTAESSSPDDLRVLTPGHFLVQRPLTAPPSDFTIDEHTAYRTKWTMVQFVVHRFWRRWVREYLLLQQRASKWTAPDFPASIGQLVLLADDNLLPLSWITGRITKLHFGKDGISRVAEVQTNTGVYQRPLRKLCPLPTQ